MFSILEGSLGSPSQLCIKSWKTLKELEQNFLNFMKYKKADTKNNANWWSYFKYVRKLSLSIYCKWYKPESFQNASK